MERNNRRKFLKLSGLAAACAALPQLSQAFTHATDKCSQAQHTDYDIAIVGAGISGLTTAYILDQIGFKKIIVIEAKDRVGGRTLNLPVQGGVAEGGGQWVGSHQLGILTLLEILGIETFPSYGSRDGNIEDNFPQEVRRDINLVKQKLNALAAQIPLHAPWRATKASDLDSTSIGEWIIQNTDLHDTQQYLQATVAAQLSTDPFNISLLYYLFYLQSSGGFDALAHEAQQIRIKGGAQALSLRLAESLKGKIKLASPVASIDDQQEYLSLEIAGCDRNITARKVVMAMMPKEADNIHFIQGLPEQRTELQKYWPTASGAKVSVVYDKPFWRPALADNPEGGPLLSNVVDNSPDDASIGVLMGFPTELYTQLPENIEQRLAIVVQELSAHYGSPALYPIDFAEFDWSEEPYTAGCVSPLSIGFLTKYGQSLRQPIGNIHWSGTETSMVGMGYMDGAVIAGVSTVWDLLGSL